VFSDIFDVAFAPCISIIDRPDMSRGFPEHLAAARRVYRFGKEESRLIGEIRIERLPNRVRLLEEASSMPRCLDTISI